MEKLSLTAKWIIRIVGSVIFIWLAWYASRYTQYMVPGGEEIPINVRDSMIKNILSLGCALALLLGAFLLEEKLPIKVRTRISRCLLAVSLIGTGAGGLWWITVVDRQPEGDQAFVYGGASMFLENNYDFLAPRGYCGMYPYQLGLIFLVELLFLLVGTYNYYACQVVCVAFAVGIVYLGYRLVKKITNHMLLAGTYCLLMMGGLPLIFYCGWVYGDLPSTFFMILAANFLWNFGQKGSWKSVAGIVFSLTMAIMFRQNSLILLVALGLLGSVHILLKRDKKLLVALILSLICPMLVSSAIRQMYEMRSGYEQSDGIPMYTHIAMGLQEENGKYGWDTEYSKQVYYGAECDTDVAKEISKADIRERVAFFLDNPGYAETFFKEKLLSQWNEPLYQSLYFSNKFWAGEEPDMNPDSLVAKINDEYFPRILGFCDRLQFVLYVGMLCYFIFATRKEISILQHLLAVGMIGGFLFSMIYEAKARYILPYYLMMFPMAVVGFYNFFIRMMPLFLRVWERRSKAEMVSETSQSA